MGQKGSKTIPSLSYATISVCIEDLQVSKMSQSAAGTAEKAGKVFSKNLD
ncbi:MAG: hypothetical protein S4CHLAM123_02270 [Chlamydiales bacterium]|nr:hypothetical protein [Chlamydiales bacterium]